MALGVAQHARGGEIKGELYPAVRGIDVLTAGPGGAGKAFAELGLRDDEAIGDTGAGDDLQAVHEVDASSLAATVGGHPVPPGDIRPLRAAAGEKEPVDVFIGDTVVRILSPLSVPMPEIVA